MVLRSLCPYTYPLIQQHYQNIKTIPRPASLGLYSTSAAAGGGLKAIGFHSTSTVSLSLVGHEHEWKFLYDIRGVHVPTSTPPPDSRKWASVLKRFSPFYYCCHLQPYPPRHGRFASGLKDIQMTTTSKAPFPWPLTSSPSRGGHWMGTKLGILRPIKYCKLIIPSKHQTTDPPSHLDI